MQQKQIVMILYVTVLLNFNLVLSYTVSCGDTISSPGYYVFSPPAEPASGTCISISSNDVILDCNGTEMVGSDTDYGISIIGTGYHNITIKNCTISHFVYGIYRLGASGYELYFYNVFVRYTPRGIWLYDSNSRIRIENFTFMYNQTYGDNVYGIWVYKGSDVTMKNLNVTSVNQDPNMLSYGVYLQQAANIAIFNSTLRGSDTGLYSIQSVNITLVNSSLKLNSLGLHLDSTNASSFYNCVFENEDNINCVNSYNNTFNTTKRIGERIYTKGTYIGGNFWGGDSGYSVSCVDADRDGFCDQPFYTGCGYDELPYSTKFGIPEFFNFTNLTTSVYRWQGYQFNVTWVHPRMDGSIFSAILESNFSGSFKNESMSLAEPMNETTKEGLYSFEITLKPGTYSYRFCGKDESGYVNCTSWNLLHIAKSEPSMSIFINGSTENTTMKWHEVLNLTFIEDSWVDRDVNYTVYINDSKELEFTSSNLTTKRELLFCNKSSGVYVINFTSVGGENFTSTSRIVMINVTKSWKIDGNPVVGESYEFDYGKWDTPIVMVDKFNDSLNDTVFVDEPFYVNFTVEINNTNGNSGLTDSFSGVIVNLTKLLDLNSSLWRNYTKAIVTLNSIGYGETKNVTTVFFTYPVVASNNSCEVAQSSDRKRYTCQFNVSVLQDFVKEYEIVYNVSASLLPQWDSRVWYDWSVDGSKENTTLDATNSFVVFVVGTNHSNSSLEKGDHVFYLTYDVPLSSSSTSASGSSSGTSGGLSGGGAAPLGMGIDEMSLIISEIRPENPRNVVVRINNISLRYIVIATKEEVSNARVKIRKVDPTTIKEKVGKRLVYDSFEVKLEASALDKVTISFNVSKEWLKRVGREWKDVKIAKVMSETLLDLPKIFWKEDKTSYWFNVTLRNFSTFVVYVDYAEATKRDESINPTISNVENLTQEVNHTALAKNETVASEVKGVKFEKMEVYMFAFAIIGVLIMILFYMRKKPT